MITGNTYPHRKHLNSLGLRWNGALKAWTGNESNLISPYSGKRYANVVPDGCKLVAVGQPGPTSSPARNDGLCHRCGTYCCGDCEAS